MKEQQNPRSVTTATDMWQAFQSHLAPLENNSPSFIEHKDPKMKRKRREKREEHQAEVKAKRRRTGGSRSTKQPTPAPSPPKPTKPVVNAKVSFSSQPPWHQRSDVTTQSYMKPVFKGFHPSFPVPRDDPANPIRMGQIQLVTSPVAHKVSRQRTSSASKTRKRKTQTLKFRFQGYESFHHPLTKIALQVHLFIKNPDGGPAKTISADQLKMVCKEVLGNPSFVIGGLGYSHQHGREQVAQLQLANRTTPVLLRASEYQTSPVSDQCSNFKPLSEAQALYFWTQTQLLDPESRTLLLKTFSKFLSLDNCFATVLAFAGCLKPSSRRTYASAIRMFIKGLQELYPGEFESLQPFTLLSLMREGKVTRNHVRAVFTYRRLADEIDVSTFGVTVSALKWAWKTACLEDLLRPQDFQLAGVIKSLRKAFASAPQGGDVFTQKELHAFFQVAAETATDLQEQLWALTFCWASKFMLRRSEMIRLERDHVHIHQEPLNFEMEDMITVELVENKSYMYRTQSVSYFLKESKGRYDPANLCDEISKCHRLGRKSEWFASTTSRLSERKYFRFFNKCVEQFQTRFSAYATRRFVFHSLRASEIVELFNKGVQIDIIRQKARHAQWSTTFGSYASKALRLTRANEL